MNLPQPLGLLNPAGPAQFDYLIHFCGRPFGLPGTPLLPQAFRDLTPPQKLDSILAQARIVGFPPFSKPPTPQPVVVSFSESPIEHIEWLIADRQWPPWGVVVWRQKVYEAGGGPVWHARPDQYATLTDAQRAWAVRLDTSPTGGRSEWMHEREWRLPVSPTAPALPLDRSIVAAVLIGDPLWQPSWRPVATVRFVNGVTAEEVDPGDMYAVPVMHSMLAQPSLWPGLLRLYWDVGQRKVLPVPQ